MLVLSLNVTDVETLGSYHKVNSYYDYLGLGDKTITICIAIDT